MKKLLLPFITVLIIGTVVGIVTLHHAPAATPTTTAKKAQVRGVSRQSLRPRSQRIPN